MLHLHARRIWLVHSISLARLAAIILFAALATGNSDGLLLPCLYGFAIFTDSVDGFASRRLKAGTYFGQVLDLVSDKSLTAVSLLYAATRGVDLFPVSAIATRDVIMLGMRLVTVDGNQLLSTSRLFGGIMAALLWGNTLVLLIRTEASAVPQANIVYWVCSIVFSVNLAIRIYVSAPRIDTVAIEKK